MVLVIVGLAFASTQSAYAAESNVTRLAGETRYETAAKTSESAFVASSTDTVIIATGENFADALTGSALAGASKAPILLVSRDALPQATANEIVRLQPAKIYVLGKEAAVNEKVVTQIKGLFKNAPSVTRLGGDTRYETAELIATEVVKLGGKSNQVYLATGEKFADAAALASFAASQQVPILLTPSNGDLNQSAQKFIKNNNVNDVVIAGSTSAVPKAAEDKTKALGVSTVRKGGAERFATCEELVTHLIGKYGMTNNVTLIGVAVGEGDRFPDALTGGAAVGVRGGVGIISPTNDSSFSTRMIGKIKGTNKPKVEIYGGNNVISTGVESAIEKTAPKPEPNAPTKIFLQGEAYLEIVNDTLVLSGDPNMKISTLAELETYHLRQMIVDKGIGNAWSADMSYEGYLTYLSLHRTSPELVAEYDSIPNSYFHYDPYVKVGVRSTIIDYFFRYGDGRNISAFFSDHTNMSIVGNTLVWSK